MIQLRVLGPPRIAASNGRSVDSIVRQPKRMALLAYLGSATPRGPHRRDKLLALFWPESDELHARAALNQALYVLRTRLGEDAIVSGGDGEVGLDPRVIWCDAAAFEEALDAGQAADAHALYRGDLLDGFFIAGAPEFEQWADQERWRLRQRASEGAWALAESSAARGSTVDAERWARRAADLLPADEAVVRRLMIFLHELGDRAAAIRAYEAFAWGLTREYELEPSAETRSLASAIRDKERPVSAPGTVDLPAARRYRTATIPGYRAMRTHPFAATAVIGVAFTIGASLVWPRAPDPVRRQPSVFPLSFEHAPPIASDIAGTTIALSPDGRYLVYLGAGERGAELYLRLRDRVETTAIPHTLGASNPFFSPDGEWLAFVEGNRIRKVRLAGGGAVDICTVTTNVSGASWADNQIIVFATPSGLWKVPASGGDPVTLARSDTARGERYRWPDMLPGGRDALFTIGRRTGFGLASVSLSTGTVRSLALSGTSPRFVEPGFLVFARPDGTLLAARFDPRALRLTGPALPVLEGVDVGMAGASKLGISADGALAYVASPPDNALVLVDTAGRAEPVPIPRGDFADPRFSRDGKQIVTTISPSGESPDIWLIDLGETRMHRLTFDSGSVAPVLSNIGGRRIAFASKPGGRAFGFAIRWMATDGSDSAETLISPAVGQIPIAFTPDDRALLFQRREHETGRDLWILPLDGARIPAPYLSGRGDERGASLSPDGAWVAYVSDESGGDEVYVTAFPIPGRPVPISSGGGHEPRWARDGRLFYRTDDGMMVTASINTTTALSAGLKRERAFDDRPFVTSRNGAAYDVHPEGRHFAMVRRSETPGDVHLMLNWLDRLRSPGG